MSRCYFSLPCKHPHMKRYHIDPLFYHNDDDHVEGYENDNDNGNDQDDESGYEDDHADNTGNAAAAYP